jgi:FMN-dependent NADH-azoreductase
MSATLDPFKNPLRRIADDLVTANKRAAKKPLCRVQEYLEALQECADKLIEFFLKVEKLVVIVALISFFIWGALHLLTKVHS